MDVRVEELGPAHADALRSLLLRDVAHHLPLLERVEQGGGAFWGRFQSGQLTCAVFVGDEAGLVIPTASEPTEIAEVAQSLSGWFPARSCTGDAAAVEALSRSLFGERPRTSVLQRLFTVTADDLGPFTQPALRPAQEADLPEVLALAAAHAKESLRRDLLAEDPAAFEASVLERIRAGRTHVLASGGRLVFKVDVAHRSHHGAELGGPYTLPEERGRAHATECLGQMARSLLGTLPRVTLRMNDSNETLAAVARRVGFVAGRLQRVVLA